MQIGPFTIARTKSLPPLQPLSNRGGWWPIIREPFAGAWQQNAEIQSGTALSYYAVYACCRLIATDIGKMCLRLMELNADDVWVETESPAFSPVLRRPNRYQTTKKFIESWVLSELQQGNTYVLKRRDARGIVITMHVLDPFRVTPLVTTSGDVWYEVKRDDLSGQTQEPAVFPASEIIHDTMITPYHPLIGVSPLFACGLSAMAGLNIQNNSKNFFANGANPSGMLTAPGHIGDDTAQRLKDKFASGAFSATNAGGVIVAGDGLEYKQFTMTAVDAQLIEQLQMSAKEVCGAFGVPPYLVDIGDPPPYANFEPLLIKYHSQCIQSISTNIEKSLDAGLGIEQKLPDGTQYGTEFDIDDLIWMDTATRTKSAVDAIGGAALSPNEARKKYFGIGPIAGGASAYMQEQNYSLEALTKRDAQADPFATAAPQPKPTPVPETPQMAPARPRAASFRDALQKKALAAGLIAA